MQRMNFVVRCVSAQVTREPVTFLPRYYSWKARMTDELIPNVVKYQGLQYNQDVYRQIIQTPENKEKVVENVNIFKGNLRTKEKSSGEEVWEAFMMKYKTREMSVHDVVDLFKAVHAEAKFPKYKETPGPIYTLSVCSMAPFCALGVMSLFGGTAFQGLVVAQLAYGASVLAFLGGLGSGHAIAAEKTDFETLSWAVVPPLIAWVAPLMPLPLGFVFTAMGFTTTLIHDVLLTSYPDWLKALRFALTISALIALTPSFIVSLL